MEIIVLALNKGLSLGVNIMLLYALHINEWFHFLADISFLISLIDRFLDYLSMAQKVVHR